MPKTFSAEQRERVRQLLKEKGKALFEIYGLRKTTIEEITRECGIAKGTFYAFFRSKEDLFLSVADDIQDDFWERAIEWIKSTDENPREVFKDFYGGKGFFKVLDENPILNIFLNEEEFSHLTLNLSPEQIQGIDTKVDNNFRRVFSYWREKGYIENSLTDDIIIGMIDGFYYMHLHRDDIGKGVFPEVQDRMIDMLAREIFTTP